MHTNDNNNRKKVKKKKIRIHLTKNIERYGILATFDGFVRACRGGYAATVKLIIILNLRDWL